MIMYVEVTIINSIAAIEPSDLMTDKKKSFFFFFQAAVYVKRVS